VWTALGVWCEGNGEGVKAELAAKVAASAGVHFIDAGDGAHHPARVNRFGEGREFFGEVRVAQNWVLNAGSEFEEIGEEAVENGELIFERRVAVLGEDGCGRKKLSEALAAGGALEDLEGVAAAFGGCFDVHFEGQAGAAFGELGGF
jgi:hypothetical protein